MNRYERPEAEIVAFSNEDVITTSSGVVPGTGNYGSNESTIIKPQTGFDMNN